MQCQEWPNPGTHRLEPQCMARWPRFIQGSLKVLLTEGQLEMPVWLHCVRCLCKLVALYSKQAGNTAELQRIWVMKLCYLCSLVVALSGNIAGLQCIPEMNVLLACTWQDLTGFTERKQPLHSLSVIQPKVYQTEIAVGGKVYSNPVKHNLHLVNASQYITIQRGLLGPIV